MATYASSTPRSTRSTIARENPDQQVVFFGIGFETTAPPNAMTVYQAKKLGIENFSLLVSHVRVPPAIEAIMTSPVCRVQAFLAAGHVCTVMGMGEYPELAERFGVPIVVTGFEPLDILEGIRRTVHQLEEGRHEVENAYPRAVAAEGNPVAIRMLEDVFEVVDRAWRGIGMIPQSGWRLSERYREYDAEHRFSVARHPHPGVVGLPQRRGAAGPDQAARVRGVRQGVHAAQPARRDHGLQRGRVRGVLPLPADAGAGRRRQQAAGGELPLAEQLDAHDRRRRASRAGPARCRCATARRS